MSHRKNKHERNEHKADQELRKQLMRMARFRLQKAIEWIDTKDGSDATWALVNAKGAVKMLEVAKDI